MLVTRVNELCDALAGGNDVVLFDVAVVEDDFKLAAEIGIDGAGRVENDDAVLESEAGPRTNLNFETDGNVERETGGESGALSGRNDDGMLDGGVNVEPGGSGGGTDGKDGGLV